MGLFDNAKKLFGKKDKGKQDELPVTEAVTEQPDEIQEDFSIELESEQPAEEKTKKETNDLLGALDKVSSDLGKYGLSDDCLENYAKELNTIKTKLDGAPCVETIDTLYDALKYSISYTLPDGFKIYAAKGDENKLKGVINVINTGIDALAAEKIDEQRFAAIDVNIITAEIQIWKSEYAKEQLESEQDMYYEERKRLQNLKGTDEYISANNNYKLVTGQIETLELKITASRELIDKLKYEKNNILSEITGEDFERIKAIIIDLIKKLPTDADIKLAIQNYIDSADVIRAEKQSTVNMFKDMLGMTDEELLKHHSEETEKQDNSVSGLSDSVQNDRSDAMEADL